MRRMRKDKSIGFAALAFLAAMLVTTQVHADVIVTNAGPSDYPYLIVASTGTILHPGDSLVIGFTVGSFPSGSTSFVAPTSFANCPTDLNGHPLPNCPPLGSRIASSTPATPNELDLGFSFFNSSQMPGTTFEFYDGATLIYSYTVTGSGFFESLSFTLSSSRIDFTSILNGTFNGRLEISNPNHDLSFPWGAGLEMTEYYLRQITHENGWSRGSVPLYPGISVNSAEVVEAGSSPVPEPASLLLLGTGLGVIGWRRRK